MKLVAFILTLRKCQAAIALVRTPAHLSATETIADWLNSPKAQKTTFQSDAVVHLAGTLKPDCGDDMSANVKTTERIVSALNKAQTKRVVFLI